METSDWPSLAQLAAKRPTPDEIFERNKPYVRPGDHNYNSPLDPLNELKFRDWVAKNNVPFDPEARVSDYDMRGFWQAAQRGDPRAKSGVDANDGRIHYSDVWKTPYHETFSGAGGPYTVGSQWAAPIAPQWNSLDQLVSPGGRIMFDDRAQR